MASYFDLKSLHVCSIDIIGNLAKVSFCMDAGPKYPEKEAQFYLVIPKDQVSGMLDFVDAEVDMGISVRHAQKLTYAARQKRAEEAENRKSRDRRGSPMRTMAMAITDDLLGPIFGKDTLDKARRFSTFVQKNYDGREPLELSPAERRQAEADFAGTDANAVKISPTEQLEKEIKDLQGVDDPEDGSDVQAKLDKDGYDGF
jgi:hypothetical protein